MQMPHTTRPRRDPLNEVVDVDSLNLARQIRSLNHDWEDGEVPLRPLATVRFEGLRQIATFAIPTAIIGVASTIAGFTGALYAAPVALLAGAALDFHLQRDLKIEQAKRTKIDGGHYEWARSLCARLNLRPEEITMRRIDKMDDDFTAYIAAANASWAARTAVVACTPDYNDPAVQRSLGVQQAHARTASADHDFTPAPAPDMFAHNDYADAPDFSTQDLYPDINTNGLPMISGAAIDVGGHAFGSMPE